MNTTFGSFTKRVYNVFSLKNQIWNFITIRTRMRYHFPRPNERKRVVHQGFFARISTTNGRKILMRRILKGRHVLGH